jgi:hypothetical protein
MARSLLKWNLHDLASYVKSILIKRIDNFEHGIVHLLPWENEELIRVFKKAGIAFNDDLEVTLAKDRAEQIRPQNVMHGEGARIVLGVDQTVLSDSSADKPQIPGLAYEDDKRGEDKGVKT